MSPTVFRHKGYRFFFFSREESRIHIHVYCADGEAKFWLEPEISLANFVGLTKKQINELLKVVEDRKHDIKDAWKTHFGS